MGAPVFWIPPLSLKVPNLKSQQIEKCLSDSCSLNILCMIGLSSGSFVGLFQLQFGIWPWSKLPHASLPAVSSQVVATGIWYIYIHIYII